MRIVIQKVLKAHVTVDEVVVGSIDHGYVLLVGIENGDSLQDCDKAAQKIAMLRLFEDENGKINRSIQDVGGSILAISQFTLAGDARKGNRPSFIKAMKADEADVLFNEVVSGLKSQGISVETGVFQTHMNVVLDNDGPVTLVLDIKDGKVL